MQHRQILERIHFKQKLIKDHVEQLGVAIQELERALSPTPPPLPLELPKPAQPTPLPPKATPQAIAAVAKSPPVFPAPAATLPPEQTNDLEFKIGSVWLVRLGVVLLLTGFVFLGNYAYQHIVPMLGTWSKISLMAACATALMLGGRWCEKSRRELRHYGRVVMAGGAALGYYTGYAAHFVERLRVIESPLAGGALLLLCAGGLLGYALRRRSALLAAATFGLAFWTGAINPSGGFSFLSTALLAVCATITLPWRGWVKPAWVGLLGAYGSFIYWLVAHDVWHRSAFFPALLFLAVIWTVLTACAVLTTRGLGGAARTSFLSLNNVFAFLLAAEQIANRAPQQFWLFALGSGAALIALSEWIARRHGASGETGQAQFAQGIALATTGLVAKFDGPIGVLVLSVESVLLALSAGERHRWLSRAASLICSGLAVMRSMDCAPGVQWASWVVCATMFYLAHHHRPTGEKSGQDISLLSLGFSLLSLIPAVDYFHATLHGAAQVLALAGLTVGWLGAAWLLRVVEPALIAQLILPGALVLWAHHRLGIGGSPQPWWSLLGVIAAWAAGSAWWKFRQPFGGIAETEMRKLAGLLSSVAALLLAVWNHEHVATDWHAAFYLTCAAAGLVAGAWSQSTHRQIIGILYAALGAGFFLKNPAATPQDAAALVLVPVAWRIARWRWKASPLAAENLRSLMPAAASALWLAWTTRWAGQVDWNHTVAWSLLGLVVFAAGLALRERTYRLAGLGTLGLALARIFSVDVWRLDTLGRVLSFMTLGAALMLLGYIYNRFAEQLRRWL